MFSSKARPSAGLSSGRSLRRVAGTPAAGVTLACAAALCSAAEVSAAGDSAADPAGGQSCSDAALAVAIDGLGRTLVAGAAYDNRLLEWAEGHAHFGDLALARLTEDGELDRRFGRQGTLVVDVGDFDAIQQLLVLPGGEIVAAGTSAQHASDRAGPASVVLLRLDERGRPGRGARAGGPLVLDLAGDATVSALVAAPGEAAAVAGSVEEAGHQRGFVAKVTSAGDLDQDFGEAGVAWLEGARLLPALAAEEPEAQVLAVRPAGRGLWVGGTVSVAAEASAFVGYLDEQGQLVTSGSRRPRTSALGGSLDGAVAFFGPGGTLAVTARVVGSASGAETRTAYFAPSPRRPAYSAGGLISLALPAGARPADGALWWGESLLVSGAIYPEDFATGDAFLARLDAAGRLQPAFAGGLVLEHFALEYAAFMALAPTASGVTVAGWDFSEAPGLLPDSDAVAARFGRDGLLDPSFGDAGVAHVDFRRGQRVCGPTVHVGEVEEHAD